MYSGGLTKVDRLLRFLDSLPDVGYTVLRTKTKYDASFDYVKVILEEPVITETMEDFSEHISEALRLLGVPIVNWHRTTREDGYRWLVEDAVDGSYFELQEDDSGIVIRTGQKVYISTQKVNVHSNQFLRAYRRILKPE